MSVQFAIPVANASARPILPRAIAAVGTALRTWRERIRDRDALAAIPEFERNDLPFARQIDIRSEIAKPFWRA